MLTRRIALAAAAGAIPATLMKVSGSPGKKALRYLQIGTGHAHASKISVYAGSGDWEVVGIVEEDAAARARAMKNPVFNQFKFMTLEEGLNFPDLQVVGIETEVRDLLKYARIAVQAGYHVHLDKPAGNDLEQYKKILQSADAQDLVVQMGYMYRFNPAVILLHRMIAAGWLGEIFETHAVMSKVVPPVDRLSLAEFSGGTMFELGCHIIDLTIGVLGRPDSITAHPRRVIENDTLNDNMLAVLEYPKATATVRSSALEVKGSARRHFTVCGTEGTFHIQPLDRPLVKLALSRERSFGAGERMYVKGLSEIKFEPPYARYRGDAADLAAIVRHEKANSYPSAHDIAVQEAVIAASGVTGATA